MNASKTPALKQSMLCSSCPVQWFEQEAAVAVAHNRSQENMDGESRK